MGTGMEGVQIAMDRIMQEYSGMQGTGAFLPSYEVIELDE